MRRNVVQIGDEVLRKICRPIKKFDGELWAILQDMRDTVIAENGAGLAAPQIGLDLRMAVVNVEEGYFELINPKIVYSKGEQEGPEGCLSVKGKQGTVVRPYKVRVEYQDRKGKKHTLTAEDFFARAICHELDHLDGVIYVDKAFNIIDVGEEE